METLVRELEGFCGNITEMLDQFTSFYKDNQCFYCFLSRDLTSYVIGDFLIVSATEKFKGMLGKCAMDVLSEDLWEMMSISVQKRKNMYHENYVFVYFAGKNGTESVLCLEMKVEPAYVDTFELLMKWAGFYVDNYALKREMDVSQKEFFFMLGEVAEIRSHETVGHTPEQES